MCVSITSDIFAHRTRPALLIQEVRIENPTVSRCLCTVTLVKGTGCFTFKLRLILCTVLQVRPVTLNVEQAGISNWAGVTTESKK